MPELTNNRSQSARGSKSSRENAARHPVLTTCSPVTNTKALPAAALAVTYAGVPRWEGRAVLQGGEQMVSPHCGPPRTSPPNPPGAGPHWVCAHQHPTIGSGLPRVGGGPAHRPSTNLGWTGFSGLKRVMEEHRGRPGRDSFTFISATGSDRFSARWLGPGGGPSPAGTCRGLQTAGGMSHSHLTRSASRLALGCHGMFFCHVFLLFMAARLRLGFSRTSEREPGGHPVLAGQRGLRLLLFTPPPTD